MAEYGQVQGRYAANDNFKAQHIWRRESFILTGTKDMDLRDNQPVRFDDIRRWADTKAARKVQTLDWDLEVRALDTMDISALVLYEKEESNGTHYVVAGKGAEEVERAFDQISEMGYSGGNRRMANQRNGGILARPGYSVGDFRPEVAEEPVQEGVLFAPLEGLVSQLDDGFWEIDDGTVALLLKYVSF